MPALTDDSKAGSGLAAALDETQPLVLSQNKKEPVVVSSPKKMGENTEKAITFRNAYKHYGRGSRKVPVLIGLDMNIPKGAIYGLLGPSGCGKTTLLQCIVGKQRLKSGEVIVFGGVPGSRVSGVPGHRVGYMPQELALYGEFTIAETLQYFGRIFNIPRSKIAERTEFLMNFLDLPKTKGRLIMNLSGGQQRRASLAAALLHEPELLILDEPTVGVDPLLRQCIWSHLLEISKSSHLQTTIVITTHYIEEARQANVVGMMRYGKLLAENHPDSLMEKFNRPNLEDVFLLLCLGDERERGNEDDNDIENRTSIVSDQGQGKKEDVENPDSIALEELNAVKIIDKASDKEKPEKKNEVPADIPNGTKVSNNGTEDPISHGIRESRPHESGLSSFLSFLTLHRLSALLVKNFIRMWRNIGFLIFQFIIPTVQVSLFCLAIGRDPTGMSMAIFNEDVSMDNLNCQVYDYGCILGDKDDFFGNFDWNPEHRSNLSCRYLSYLDSEIIEPVFYTDFDLAMNSVKKGKHWGLIHFKANYSQALFDRMFGVLANLEVPNNETIDSSEVHTYLDMTNQQVGYTIQLRLAESYQSFSQGILSSCDVPGQLASLPIVFEEPVYGSNEPTFTEFMAPGVILSITYFMAVGLTALSFIIERKEGLLDRSWVAGVTASEVMLAHVIAQFVVMVVQVALVLVFMIYVFKVPAEGPMIWIILLTIFQGICGMAFGLVISAMCDNEQDAIQVALGSFYPNLLLSGIIWPLEGMPEELRYLSYALPQTYACEAMRGMLSRGWGIEWMQVYRGYGVTLAWTVVLLVLSAIILRVRR